MKSAKLSAPHLWTVMTRSHHAVQRVAEASIVRTDLCLTDFAVLEALLHKGPLTITELQDKVLLASGSMTAAVDRLEARGLVTRQDDAEDRRSRIIHLTDAGRELIERVFAEHREAMEDAVAGFQVEERAALIDSLRRLGRLAEEKF
jgi:MarR family transcriptional regulator, 2-MHQ and catechol-resistance regulon repressor